MNIKIAHFYKSKSCKFHNRKTFFVYCNYVRHNNGNATITIMFFTYVLGIYLHGLDKNKENYKRIF